MPPLRITPMRFASDAPDLNSSDSATATATAELGSMMIYMRSHTSRIAATISSSLTVMIRST